MKVYRIKRLEDGLFSTGASSPRFNKNGKTWNQINHVKSHLNIIKDTNRFADIYINCAIIEYELNEVSSIPLNDLIFEKLL